MNRYVLILLVFALSGCARFMGPDGIPISSAGDTNLSGTKALVVANCDELRDNGGIVNGNRRPINFTTIEKILQETTREYGFDVTDNASSADFRLTFSCQKSKAPPRVNPNWFNFLAVLTIVVPIPKTEDFVVTLQVEDLREGEAQIIDEQEAMGPEITMVYWLPFLVGNLFMGFEFDLDTYEKALKNTAHIVLNESLEGYAFD